MCKGLEESMCLRGTENCASCSNIEGSRDSKRISYRVSIKHLVRQGKKCVLYTKSNREMDSRVLSKKSGMIRFVFENHQRLQE